jgi:hypothetical protein
LQFFYGVLITLSFASGDRPKKNNKHCELLCPGFILGLPVVLPPWAGNGGAKDPFSPDKFGLFWAYF